MNRVSRSHVEATGAAERKGWHVYGGPVTALRAYQHWHPDAAIYDVTYRGRTVWMTSKQRAIWSEVQKYWKRSKRDSLQRIASVVGCSKATVSRFLRRLDHGDYIDLAALRGRGGGTYILTRVDPYNEGPRKWTSSARQRVRDLLAKIIRRDIRARLEPRLAQYRVGRLPKPPYWQTADQLRLGSTDATFNRHNR